MTDIISKAKPGFTTVRLRSRPQLKGTVKRAFDICAAFWGLIFLSPLFILLAILIKRESPGPAFYRGPRVGRDGKIFGILKFRTMYECPASYEGPSITALS